MTQVPIRIELERVFEAALRKAFPDAAEIRFEVSKPRDKAFGDYATNVAMVAAKKLRVNPIEVAARVVDEIDVPSALIAAIEVRKPGFINLVVAPETYTLKLKAIATSEDGAYGSADIGKSRKVQVEFVSANPTGPLNVVSARAAAVGDALVRLLSRVGYDAYSEFYINDSGTQVELLGASLMARFREVLGQTCLIPEGGYPGEYLKVIAGEVAALARAADGMIDVEAAAGLLPAPDHERREVARFIDETFAGEPDELACQKGSFDDYLDFRAGLSADRLAAWPALYVCRLSASGLNSAEITERLMWVQRFRSSLRDAGSRAGAEAPDAPDAAERVFLGEAVDGVAFDFARFAVRGIVEGQRASLERFGNRPEGGLRFDRWFHESSLRDDVADVCRTLISDGRFVIEKEGAVWLKGGEEEDQDEWVIRRSTGQPTYFLSDITYHVNKRRRGFDRVIDIWGPDHHGHVARMQTAMQVASEVLPDVEIDKDWLTILIAQQVNLIKDGKRVQMSKRAGEYVTLDDVVNDVGADVARFFFLMRRCNSHLDFDLDLARMQSDENPVYYVQYAHARISSILKYAGESGYDKMPPSEADLLLLSSEEELDVIKALADFDDLVVASALALEPHRLTGYLVDLASRFHRFYHNHRVVTDDRAATLARLYLCYAVRAVIRSALSLLGISAPDQM
jgi:arginyl-tRNA synthetase